VFKQKMLGKKEEMGCKKGKGDLVIRGKPASRGSTETSAEVLVGSCLSVPALADGVERRGQQSVWY